MKMPPSKLSSGWDTEGALTREELDPTFAFPQFYEVSMFPSHKKASRNYVQPAVDSPRYNYRCAIDDVPSAYEYHRVQKQQEQRQRPKPSPLSPSVSLCSTYGRKPMCEAPHLGEDSHRYAQGYRAARGDLGPPVWAHHKAPISKPTPQKKTSSEDVGCCLVM
ncbi:hypothetical protein BCIN_14g01050 [Botrytis cinerea B05.10]|uniref:Uncharacterized protein n=2 Tax=Botryotinia fuckeliana TaxID=40559 RepID=A0A384K235_BOTFB|nr:hypothetical protein BCIN_14g01050 [Botrytis cinerea B05.10]ATZ56896.1 hypothetical protein BCIN_14g01050 [Botrytis cinerea B05.10]